MIPDIDIRIGRVILEKSLTLPGRHCKSLEKVEPELRWHCTFCVSLTPPSHLTVVLCRYDKNFRPAPKPPTEIQ